VEKKAVTVVKALSAALLGRFVWKLNLEAVTARHTNFSLFF